MPKADRAFIVRGLEESYCGADLVALTGPYLDEQTVCYVTTRKAGRQALDLLLPLAEKGNVAAIDALGVIGGPKAVAALRRTLNKDEPRSATLAFRSAKALARAGTRRRARRPARRRRQQVAAPPSRRGRCSWAASAGRRPRRS